ncbi:phage tail assembly protein T [Halomonas elongata]|uniref:phage tail assembly protein T n=1 Tax=Halomonas elongata TaxID=2746 RepID=UPI00186B6487|nr:hypothetical protein [Halomonas elongata]MBW5800059.1 hypothetical protein [Halomonas elongata]
MCGIGGRTIAEAQQRLSYTEFRQWVAFRNKRGSLHWGMRSERDTAMLATLYANHHRNPHAPPHAISDFMLHDRESEGAISLEEAMEKWQ